MLIYTEPSTFAASSTGDANVDGWQLSRANLFMSSLLFVSPDCSQHPADLPDLVVVEMLDRQYSSMTPASSQHRSVLIALLNVEVFSSTEYVVWMTEFLVGS
jgi:hypothetical protein